MIYLVWLLSAFSFAADLTPQQMLRADRLISVFENEKLDPQYAYIENLHDGRGFTAGRSGFCTGCGDLLLVVEKYTKEVPRNRLVSFLPELRRLALDHSDSVQKLATLPGAWSASARDKKFRQAQDAVSDSLYYRPARKHADTLGLRLPLSRVALYEAIIQHGNGEDPDGLAAMIKRATKKAGGTPLRGLKEEVWLESFLQVRKATLLSPHNSKTKEEWRASVGRANSMLGLYRLGNLDFHGPLHVNPFGTPFQIP